MFLKLAVVFEQQCHGRDETGGEKENSELCTDLIEVKNRPLNMEVENTRKTVVIYGVFNSRDSYSIARLRIRLLST